MYAEGRDHRFKVPSAQFMLTVDVLSDIGRLTRSDDASGHHAHDPKQRSELIVVPGSPLQILEREALRQLARGGRLAVLGPQSPQLPQSIPRGDPGSLASRV